MLQEYFWTAYYPIGPKSEKPITGTNEVYVPGVFGDIFDVIFAYPDVKKWTTHRHLSRWSIAAGDIELTAAEGQRLAKYVAGRRHAAGRRRPPDRPGLAALELPALGAPAEADGYRWLRRPGPSMPSQRFSLPADHRRPAAGDDGGRQGLLRRLRSRQGPADLSVGAARPGHRPAGGAGASPGCSPI